MRSALCSSYPSPPTELGGAPWGDSGHAAQTNPPNQAPSVFTYSFPEEPTLSSQGSDTEAKTQLLAPITSNQNESTAMQRVRAGVAVGGLSGVATVSSSAIVLATIAHAPVLLGLAVAVFSGLCVGTGIGIFVTAHYDPIKHFFTKASLALTDMRGP